MSRKLLQEEIEGLEAHLAKQRQRGSHEVALTLGRLGTCTTTTFKDGFPPNSRHVSMSLFSPGAICRQQGRLEEALKYHEEEVKNSRDRKHGQGTYVRMQHLQVAPSRFT